MSKIRTAANRAAREIIEAAALDAEAMAAIIEKHFSCKSMPVEEMFRCEVQRLRAESDRLLAIAAAYEKLPGVKTSDNPAET